MITRTFKIALLAALGIAFVWGIVSIFSIRFASGNLYPEYSTRRADPMGCKVLYETLSAFTYGEVSRLEDPTDFQEKPTGRRDLYFVIGANLDDHAPRQNSLWTQIEEKLEQGARVVVAIQPNPFRFNEAVKPTPNPRKDAEKDTDDPDSEEGDDGSEEPNPTDLEEDWISLSDYLEEQSLGFLMLRDKLSVPGARLYQELGFLTAETRIPSVEESITTRSLQSLAFEEDSGWETLYQVETFPVAARKSIGQGELIVFSNPYPFSNEAIYRHRASELFAWLLREIGSTHFIELQLGVVRQRGLVDLARQHGFGLALGLALAAALAFVWASSFSPAPKRRAPEILQTAAGLQATHLGFLNLLQDGIPENKIGVAAFQTWMRDLGERRFDKARAEKARLRFDRYHASSRSREETITFYKDLAQILKR